MIKILVAIFIVAFCLYGYSSLIKEDKRLVITVSTVDRRDWLEPYPFYAKVYTESNARIVLNRVDMIKTCPEIWSQIYEGQRLLLHHQAMVWRSFIIIHRDTLEPLE